MYACEYKMESVALALIKSGDSNPSQVNINGETALIVACKNNMISVATALLDTCLVNPEHNNHRALIFASKNKMTIVYEKLVKIKSHGYESYFIEEKNDLVAL